MEKSPQTDPKETSENNKQPSSQNSEEGSQEGTGKGSTALLPMMEYSQNYTDQENKEDKSPQQDEGIDAQNPEELNILQAPGYISSEYDDPNYVDQEELLKLLDQEMALLKDQMVKREEIKSKLNAIGNEEEQKQGDTNESVQNTNANTGHPTPPEVPLEVFEEFKAEINKLKKDNTLSLEEMHEIHNEIALLRNEETLWKKKIKKLDKNLDTVLGRNTAHTKQREEAINAAMEDLFKSKQQALKDDKHSQSIKELEEKIKLKEQEIEHKYQAFIKEQEEYKALEKEYGLNEVDSSKRAEAVKKDTERLQETANYKESETAKPWSVKDTISG